MRVRVRASDKRRLWEKRAVQSAVSLTCAGCDGLAHAFLELPQERSDQQAERAPVCDYCRRYFQRLESPAERQMFLGHLGEEMRRRESHQRPSPPGLSPDASHSKKRPTAQHPWRHGSLEAAP